MIDGNEAAKELERCVKQLGFTGVEVLTNVAGKELSDPAFAPFWQKAEAARRAGDDPSQRLHRGVAAVAVLFQQRARQSAGDDDRAALSDLRRRARTPSKAENPRRARRRLSRRLSGPHRPRLGRALRQPRRAAEAADRVSQARLCRHRGVHAAISLPNWCARSAPITCSWAPTIRTTWPNSIRSRTSPASRALMPRPSRPWPAATPRSCWGT